MNKVEITGRLVKDVEKKITPSGIEVAQFTLAVNRRISKEDKEAGRQSADFIDCVAWRQSASFLAQYGKKGDVVGVVGRIEKRSYINSKNVTVYIVEVNAEEVEILSNVEKAERKEKTTNYDEEFDLSGDDLPF